MSLFSGLTYSKPASILLFPCNEEHTLREPCFHSCRLTWQQPPVVGGGKQKTSVPWQSEALLQLGPRETWPDTVNLVSLPQLTFR